MRKKQNTFHYAITGKNVILCFFNIVAVFPLLLKRRNFKFNSSLKIRQNFKTMNSLNLQKLKGNRISIS